MRPLGNNCLMADADLAAYTRGWSWRSKSHVVRGVLVWHLEHRSRSVRCFLLRLELLTLHLIFFTCFRCACSTAYMADFELAALAATVAETVAAALRAAMNLSAMRWLDVRHLTIQIFRTFLGPEVSTAAFVGTTRAASARQISHEMLVGRLRRSHHWTTRQLGRWHRQAKRRETAAENRRPRCKSCKKYSVDRLPRTVFLQNAVRCRKISLNFARFGDNASVAERRSSSAVCRPRRARPCCAQSSARRPAASYPSTPRCDLAARTPRIVYVCHTMRHTMRRTYGRTLCRTFCSSV